MPTHDDPAPGPVRDIHGEEPTAQIDVDHREREGRLNPHGPPEVAAMYIEAIPNPRAPSGARQLTREEEFAAIDDREADEAARDVRRRESSAD